MLLGPADLCDEREDLYVGHALQCALQSLRDQVRLEYKYWARDRGLELEDVDQRAVSAVREFAARLPDIRKFLDRDILAAFHGDPAARSVDEVLLCYPGIRAMIHHRMAHEWHRLELPLIARITAELAHAQTGIDIHPGARIGAGFFIDHGTGVVIGETTVIGDGVRIYQGVTLGAKQFPRDASGALKKGLPRHPIVEDDVVIYAGSTVLGRVTVGRGSVIAGNVWLMHDVPPGSHIRQAHTLNGEPQMHAIEESVPMRE